MQRSAAGEERPNDDGLCEEDRPRYPDDSPGSPRLTGRPPSCGQRAASVGNADAQEELARAADVFEVCCSLIKASRPWASARYRVAPTECQNSMARASCWR